ncbi:MAG: chorismate mutase [Oscillospiraceae bacterium]|nr:chorismate mutase [Oscillospiraceae bacterium]
MDKLDILRAQIDNTDMQIINLLRERFGTVKQIGEYKKAAGLEVLQKSREAEILNNITGEYRDYILNIYKEILKNGRKLQEDTK